MKNDFMNDFKMHSLAVDLDSLIKCILGSLNGKIETEWDDMIAARQHDFQKHSMLPEQVFRAKDRDYLTHVKLPVLTSKIMIKITYSTEGATLVVLGLFY